MTGGDFNFTFNVLPGNATGSHEPVPASTSTTDASDIFSAVSGFGTPTTTTNMFYDVNGSGTINTTDASVAFGFVSGFGLKLPSGSAKGPGGFSFTSSFKSSSNDTRSFVAPLPSFNTDSDSVSSKERNHDIEKAPVLSKLAGSTQEPQLSNGLPSRDSIFENSSLEESESKYKAMDDLVSDLFTDLINTDR
jgi:hypothetical protein